MSGQPLRAPEGYLRKPEACARLRIARRTLDNWTKAGFVPFIKVGRSVYFKETDLMNAFTASGGVVQKQILEADRLRDIIRRAAAEFFRDGRTDGETAAAMLTILQEAQKR